LRLGPYELVRELGRGGFASVWLARRAGKGGFAVNVAVKVSKVELQDDPAFQKMFLDESRLQAQINHPNVVNVFELGEEGDLLYLVMEYVPGRPLNVLRNCVERAGGKIPVHIVMRVLSDTCGGLHAAHELAKNGKPLGVIHRDVSPQNILVSDKGVVKLIDFGVAKANDRLAAETTAGHTKGKLRYMAPEQAVGKALDRRADVWAVGAVAFDLLEGSPPFDGYNDLVRLFKLLEDQPVPPFSNAVPDPIRACIERCLQRDPAKRYATAADARVAIEAALDASGMKVTNDDVATFFAPWLKDDGETRERASGRGKLRERLKRPQTNASMNTIDVPPPDSVEALGSDEPFPRDETLGASAINSSVLPTQKWRVPALAVAVAIVIGAGLGLWRHRTSEDATVVAAPPPPPTVAARDEPPSPDPAVDTAATPVVAMTSQPAPSSTVASPRVKAHPLRAPKSPGADPTRPQPHATAAASRRYDDTIQ
jgi:serine/threonine-protein kinase